MVDTFYIVVGVVGLVAVYLAKTKRLKFTLSPDEPGSFSATREMGLPLKEYDIIQCPDGFIRPQRIRPNISGTYDVLHMDGETWLKNVDPNKNFLPNGGAMKLINMVRVPVHICNIRIVDGAEVPWESMGINCKDLGYLTNQLERLQRANTNMQSIGFGVQEGPNFHKHLSDTAESFGQAFGKLVPRKVQYPDVGGSKISYRGIGLDEELESGQGENYA